MQRRTINGVDLAFSDVGSGEPLLLVHGFPLSGRMWEPTVEGMGPGYRLIVPDLRGMGRSAASAEASMATYADDLAALLDALEERRPVVLVGLSMGGYIAFEFHRRHRDRLRALVLVDTRAEADTEEKRRGRLEMAERVRREGSAVVADAMIGSLFGPRAPAALWEHWREIMSATNPTGVIAALGAMASRADSIPTLAEIRVPALVVVGEEDALTPPPDARRIHVGIAGAQLKIIPDAGHMVPVEAPERFVRVLRAFVAQLRD